MVEDFIDEEIIGTPFKVKNKKIRREKNKEIRKLSAQIELGKRLAKRRQFRDTIEARGLPRRPRPGGIE